MSKPRVIVDLDNITADFFGAFDDRRLFEPGLLPRYREESGESLAPDDIQGWDMTKYVKNPALLEAVFHRPGFFGLLNPIPGAVEGIRLLEDSGYEVHMVSAAVTARSYTEKAEWCQENLPFIPLKRVHVTSDKAHFHGVAIIDDGPHNVQGWRQQHGGLAFSLDWAHTRTQAGLYDYLHPWREPETAWVEYLKRLEAR